jgi:hypothetical protein
MKSNNHRKDKIEQNILQNLKKLKPIKNETYENSSILSEKSETYNRYLNEIYRYNPLHQHIKKNENETDIETYENSRILHNRKKKHITFNKKNILKEIKDKINSDIMFAKNELNNLELNDYLFDKFQSFSFNTYNDKYSKKIIKNYVDDSSRIQVLNQIYYNYILGGTINLSINLLKSVEKEEITRLFNKAKRIKFNSELFTLDNDLKDFYKYSLKKISFNNTFTEDINIKNEFHHLLYIFFYVIPRSRRIVEFIKNNKMEKSKRFGKIDIIYKDKTKKDYTRCHPFNMERFVNYDRLDLILNKIMKINDNLTDIETYNDKILANGLYSEFEFAYFNKIKFNKYNKICPRIKNYQYKIKNPEKISFKKYFINLDIPMDLFNSKYLKLIYNELYNNSYLFIQFFTYNNIPKRLEYSIKKNDKFNSNTIKDNNSYASFNNYLGDTLHTYKNNIYIIMIILSYCLSLLKSKDIRDTIFLKIKNDIDKIKKIIIIFYYLLIYLMIFSLGTASIAETSLFTLWDAYVNIDGNDPLILNKNTMIDVEALTIPFSNFYINCFNKESDQNKYTPYFIDKNVDMINNINNKIDNKSRVISKSKIIRKSYVNNNNSNNNCNDVCMKSLCIIS